MSCNTRAAEFVCQGGIPLPSLWPFADKTSAKQNFAGTYNSPNWVHLLNSNKRQPISSTSRIHVGMEAQIEDIHLIIGCCIIGRPMPLHSIPFVQTSCRCRNGRQSKMQCFCFICCSKLIGSQISFQWCVAAHIYLDP